MNKSFSLDINAPVILGMTALSLVTLIIDIAVRGNLIILFAAYRTSFADPMQYIRLFTHVIMHADLAHYSANFMMILAVGPMVEEKYGSRRLLPMIIATAFITGLTNVIFFPGSATVGASGTVFMLILLASFTNIRHGKLPVTVPLVAVLYIGNEVMAGLFTADNISRLSHIIGGLCGACFGGVFHIKKLRESSGLYLSDGVNINEPLNHND